MSWPRRTRTTPKFYASIGDAHVDAACGRVNMLMLKACAVLTEYTPTIHTTIDMLFDPDTVRRAKLARGVVREPGSIIAYEIGTEINLSLDYDGCTALPIKRSCMQVQPDKVGPLDTYVREVKAIYEQYEEVKAVLRWLNRNATPGAIRFYWPTALQLCPKVPAFADLQEVPSRYNEPFGINARLQMLRDTAATIAASSMLPTDATARPRNKMWLTFSQRKIIRGDALTDASFTTDTMTINI